MTNSHESHAADEVIASIKTMTARTCTRERKRFNQILRTKFGCVCPASSSGNTLYLKWSVRREEVEQVLKYWNYQSALKRCQVAELMAERYGQRSADRRRYRAMKKQSCTAAADRRGSELTLVVWNLAGLVQAHARKFMPISTEHGWYRPPLLITAVDLVPLSHTEMTVLHRRSCSKLVEFCNRLILPEQLACRRQLA